MSWLFSQAKNAVASAAKNCRTPPSICAAGVSRITRPASCVNAQWQKIGTSATRIKQRQRCVNGVSRMAMLLNAIAQRTARSTTAKSWCASMALNKHGLMNSCGARATPARAVSANFNGETSKQPHTSITATTLKWCAGFSAIGATPCLVCAKTMTSCYPPCRGI